MARHNELLVPQAASAMDQLKMETAQELGLLEKIQQVGWGDMTTREVGTIGGHMVKKMISAAESSLAKGSASSQQASVAGLVGPPVPAVNRLYPSPYFTEPTTAARYPEQHATQPEQAGVSQNGPH